jgi:two-component system, chemotaxis family, protein-glutamate methylesterase/glutaminase
MVVRKEGDTARIDLNKGPPEHSCRPAVDPLFRSVASAYGPRALAVVLTGMGQDGCSGARAIVDAGGRVLAQDEATSVVWGMPGFVVRAGLATAVLPLDRVADEIVMRLARGRDSETAYAAKAWARPTGGTGAG